MTWLTPSVFDHPVHFPAIMQISSTVIKVEVPEFANHIHKVEQEPSYYFYLYMWDGMRSTCPLWLHALQQDQIQAEQSGSVSVCPALFLLSYSCRWGRTRTGILKRDATGGRGNDAQMKPAPDLLRISKTLSLALIKHLLLMSCLLRLGGMKRFGSDSQKPPVWIQRNESNRDDPAGGIDDSSQI